MPSKKKQASLHYETSEPERERDIRQMAKDVLHHCQLGSLTISGYKSFQELRDLKLKNINILIGPNGAGKSNFISFFKLLNSIVEKNLQRHVSKSGSADALLHFGRKQTPLFEAELSFGNNGYKFNLEPTASNELMFSSEKLFWNVGGDYSLGSGHLESRIDCGTQPIISGYVISALKEWRVYHFHDTGEDSRMKQAGNININDYLRTDASNLAAFLLMLKTTYTREYSRIVKTIRLVFPSFGDFQLRPIPGNSKKIQLEWKERDSSEPFLAHQFSDGTLRFICLSTLLLQPKNLMPSTILIDEPELGLHPYAIKILAGMLKSVAVDGQIIVSTQSVELIDEFEPDDILVVDRTVNHSTIKRLDPEDLSSWLVDYSLGQIWKKNLIGGRPQ